MSTWFSGIRGYFGKSQPYPTLTNVLTTLEKSDEKANLEFEELKVDTKRVSDVEKLKKKYLSVCDELKELLEDGTSKRTPPTPTPVQSGGRKKTIKRRNSKSKSKSKRKNH
jgi:hypothetical protein